MNIRFSYIGFKRERLHPYEIDSEFFYLIARPTGTTGTITGDSKFCTYSVLIKNGKMIEVTPLGKIGSYTYIHQKEEISNRRSDYREVPIAFFEDMCPGLAEDILKNFRELMTFQVLKDDYV